MYNYKRAVRMIVFLTAMVCSVWLLQGTVFAQNYFAEKRAFSWDITGDGKEDVISFVPTGAVEDGNNYKTYTSLNVYVNGERVFSTGKDGYFFSYEYKKIRSTKSGKRFLYISWQAENGDGPTILYEYKKGKLKKVIDFHNVTECRWVDKIEAKKNRLVVQLRSSGGGTGMGQMKYQAVYEYSNNRFRIKSHIHKILGYSNIRTGKMNVSYITAKQTIPLYKDVKAKTKVVDMPAGTKVKVTKCYLTKSNCAFYVTGNGYKGWYNTKDFEHQGSDGRYIDDNDVFEEVMGCA